MTHALALALLLAAAEDPAGTQALELQVGGTKEIVAPDGSRILCDDTAVATAEFADGKLQLKGVAPGSTLCGVRQPGELRGGLYRVGVVKKKASPKKD